MDRYGKYISAGQYSQIDITMANPYDRPRGILTNDDRKLLRGKVEYKHKQQYSDRRRTIRQRIANGLIDFSTIRNLLQEKDRKRIFHDLANEADIEESLLIESIRDMLYWTYFGFKEQNHDFEGVLTQAIEEAEKDFARNYFGESIDVAVRFDVHLRRTFDIDELIDRIENGGPVQANRLYDLLQLPRGVPINTSELVELRVWFNSSYPEGEKAVLETLFSEYLNTDMKIVDAEHRAVLDIEKTSAVVDPEQYSPDPSEIKNYSLSSGSDSEKSIEDLRREMGIRPSKYKSFDQDDQGSTSEDDSILGSVVDDILEREKFSIQDGLSEKEKSNINESTITSDSLSILLEAIEVPFVTTQEIADVFDCTLKTALQKLSELAKDDQIDHRSITDSHGNEILVWWR